MTLRLDDGETEALRQRVVRAGTVLVRRGVARLGGVVYLDVEDLLHIAERTIGVVAEGVHIDTQPEPQCVTIDRAVRCPVMI
jgi:hypothetical protein